MSGRSESLLEHSAKGVKRMREGDREPCLGPRWYLGRTWSATKAVRYDFSPKPSKLPIVGSCPTPEPLLWGCGGVGWRDTLVCEYACLCMCVVFVVLGYPQTPKERAWNNRDED